MSLSALLSKPNVLDVIDTQTTIFVVTSTKTPLEIYSNKHIQQITSQELLSTPHISTILSGTSIRNGELSIKTHLTPTLLYTYDLSSLSSSKKQSFSHALYGTGGRTSFLDELSGKKLGKSVLHIPPKYQEQIEAFFEEHNVTWDMKEIFVRGDVS